MIKFKRFLIYISFFFTALLTTTSFVRAMEIEGVVSPLPQRMVTLHREANIPHAAAVEMSEREEGRRKGGWNIFVPPDLNPYFPHTLVGIRMKGGNAYEDEKRSVDVQRLGVESTFRRLHTERIDESNPWDWCHGFFYSGSEGCCLSGFPPRMGTCQKTFCCLGCTLLGGVGCCMWTPCILKSCIQSYQYDAEMEALLQQLAVLQNRGDELKKGIQLTFEKIASDVYHVDGELVSFDTLIFEHQIDANTVASYEIRANGRAIGADTRPLGLCREGRAPLTIWGGNNEKYTAKFLQKRRALGSVAREGEGASGEEDCELLQISSGSATQ